MKKSDNKIHILYCSRLVVEKGVDILLEVIEKAGDDPRLSNNIIWHIASDGPYESAIRELSILPNSHVVYHGKLSQGELAGVLRDVDLLFMPSRFLETFGLTALEALASGVRVMGIKKAGLVEFIEDSLSISESNPIGSTLEILIKYLADKDGACVKDVTHFSQSNWDKRFRDIFPEHAKIGLIHDYSDRIGGAEVYLDFLASRLDQLSYTVSRSSYTGKTSPMKRRIMFILSTFLFHRGWQLTRELEKYRPDHIWMHSILRYYGYWGVRAVGKYSKKYDAVFYLSHHDVGFIAPFPQNIYSELEIPKSSDVSDFLRGLTGFKRFVAFGKWLYIQAIRSVLPEKTKHIIFSAFLESHILRHFPGSEVILLPHTFDQEIFHP